MWFDRPVMAEPFLALLDHTTQWIFNKTLLYSEAGESSDEKGRMTGEGQYLQMVISASYSLVPRSRQDIIDLCRREIAEVLPATRDASLKKATVIKEVNATFSPEPGVDRWRPAQNIGVNGLFPRRRLDPNRLARHDGRRRAQRLSRGRRCACRSPRAPRICTRSHFCSQSCLLWGSARIWAARRIAARH